MSEKPKTNLDIQKMFMSPTEIKEIATESGHFTDFSSYIQSVWSAIQEKGETLEEKLDYFDTSVLPTIIDSIAENKYNFGNIALPQYITDALNDSLSNVGHVKAYLMMLCDMGLSKDQVRQYIMYVCENLGNAKTSSVKLSIRVSQAETLGLLEEIY
jgi:hypothetical protein